MCMVHWKELSQKAFSFFVCVEYNPGYQFMHDFGATYDIIKYKQHDWSVVCSKHTHIPLTFKDELSPDSSYDVPYNKIMADSSVPPIFGRYYVL
jgi:hypothetical protein